MRLLLCALFSACGATGAAGGSEDDRVVAFVGATVVPMDSERLLHRQTVIARNGLIATLGPADSIPIPAGAERIEAAGLYLIPGLTDGHVHLRDPGELLSYLAHGVTTVVHLSGPSGNVADVVKLRDRVARGEIMGPTIYTSGRMLDGAPAIYPNVSTVVRTPEEATGTVQAQLAAGVDLIKVYNNLGADELRAAIGAAHDRGYSVWGHIPRIDGRATALQRALAAGLDVIAHAEEVFFTMFYRDVERRLDRNLVPVVGDDLMAEAVRLIRKHGTTVIPNLSFVAMTRMQLDDMDEVWSDPEARFLSPQVRNAWREQNPTTRSDLHRFDLRERGKQITVRQLTRALNAAGVRLLLGTDATASGMFPGKSAQLELTELVRAGLSAYQALATATINPGRFFRKYDPEGPPFGTATVGSRADLVLLEANPLSDVSNVTRVVGVMVRGNWYSRIAIDSRRAEQAT